MDPKVEISQPKFLGSIHDISSCGLGTQRAVVEMLRGSRAKSEYLIGDLIVGAGSNLICLIGIMQKYLGEEGPSLCSKCLQLAQHWRGVADSSRTNRFQPTRIIKLILNLVVGGERSYEPEKLVRAPTC